MSKRCVFIVLFVAFVGCGSAEVINSGRCPSDIEVVPDFQVEKYLGVWYQYARYPHIFETNGICNIAYYLPDGENRVGVYNSMTNNKTGNLDYALGYAVPVENAKLKVFFPETPSVGGANYWVLDTDYETYTCVYSCQPLALTHITFAWILTREKFPDEKTVKKCEDVFTRNKISMEPFKKTVQTGC